MLFVFYSYFLYKIYLFYNFQKKHFIFCLAINLLFSFLIICLFFVFYKTINYLKI